MGFRESLQKFKEFLDVVRGKEDPKSRVKLMLDPDKIQTSTRLSGSEIDMVTDAYWAWKQWPKAFQPLKDFVDEYCLTKISEGGKGREEAISIVAALEQSKLFKQIVGGGGVEAKPKLKMKAKETD